MGPEQAKLFGSKSYEELVSLCKDVMIGIWYGDFYSTNDNYPYMIERH